ncbi:helix-turn-helix transcriptional regulator [Chloroflexota bacterium]
MGRTLTKAEAIEYLGLDDKTFDNYFRNAGEFRCLERINGRGRFYFDEDELEEWLDSFRWRTVKLTIDDYALCLDFALAQHFRGYVLSDWGTGRQREFGQKVTNWVKGQLAEVATQKFLKNNFNVEVGLDFDIHDEIVPQDIISVVENGKTRLPKINVAIKSSKPKSSYLVLGENEVILPERKSEVYVLCRPDIPDDHLLRIARDRIAELVENMPLYPSYRDIMPDFENIPCEVTGYCWVDELEKVNSIPGQDFDGTRFVKQTGKLHRSKEDWADLAGSL